MARLAGYEPGVVTIQATNAHLYEDHYEKVQELLSRAHMDSPTLSLSNRICRVTRVEEIPGSFLRIEPTDIQMVGYESHAAIRAPMAV